MQKSAETTAGYAPIPGHGLGNAFHALQASSQYLDFLVQVRDRFISQPDQEYWLRELFWAIGTVDTTTLSALDELLHADDEKKVRAAIDLIGSAPPGFALSCPYFTIHVIEECERLGRDLGDRAASVMIGNAHLGLFQRAPGHPSPKYLTMRERSAALRDIYAADSIGRKFFSELYDSAMNALERERVEDEELRFE